MVKKSVLFVIAATAVVIGLTACTPKNTNTGGESSEPAKVETSYISMVSTPMGQSSYTTAAALCDLVSRLNPNIEMVSEESGGYGANISLLINGDAEFGMTDALALQQGYDATGDYASYPAHQIVGVTALNSAQMAIIVPAKSSIQTVNDICGKRVGIGQVGGTSLLHCLKMLEAAGIDPDKDITPYRVNSANQAEMMKNDQLDVYIWCGSYTGSAQVDLVNSVNCRVIVPDDALIDKIIEKNPSYYRTTIPGGAYPGYPEPIPTIGSQTVFFCRRDVPEETMYQIAKALFENLETLSQQSAGYRYVDVNKATMGIAVPIHPGVQRYLEEVKSECIAEHVKKYPLK